MKKLFLMAIMALLTFTSCKEENHGYSSNDIIGEWKATRIDATFSDGSTWTSSNFNELREQLNGLEWFTVTEHHFRPMDNEYGTEVLIPYSISDNHIVFTGAESGDTYYLESVSNNEMIIKYTKDWTSLIYYTKVK